MKKVTFFTVLVIFTLILGLFSFVSADGISETIKMVDQINVQIYSEIDKATVAATLQNADLDKIIDKLVCKTEKLADKMVKKAAKNGILVEKTYIEVQIGDRIVLIDPLRVVGN